MSGRQSCCRPGNVYRVSHHKSRYIPPGAAPSISQSEPFHSICAVKSIVSNVCRGSRFHVTPDTRHQLAASVRFSTYRLHVISAQFS